MDRDTVMRSWGPLSWHSFTAIISCFSVINGPMSQGSVHNSWKLKMFLPGLHLSPDMSHIEHVWVVLDQRVRQRVTVPATFQQLPTASEEEWDSILQATVNSLINSMRRRCVALHEENYVHTRYGLLFWSTPLLFLKYGICDQQIHICIPSHVKSIDWSLMNVFQFTDFLKL